MSRGQQGRDATAETTSLERDAELLRRGDVVAMLRRLAETHADLAIEGGDNARVREAMEATYTNARFAVATMPSGLPDSHEDMRKALEALTCATKRLCDNICEFNGVTDAVFVDSASEATEQARQTLGASDQ